MSQTNPPDEFPITEDCIYMNGVDGVTGDYLAAPLDGDGTELKQSVRFADIVEVIKGSAPPREQAEQLASVAHAPGEKHLGLHFTIDPTDIAKTGWGVVFPAAHGEDHPARKALGPLLRHREQQVGDAARFKVLSYGDAEGRPEEWSGWLARHGVSAGTVEPRKVPFYLLLVGSPAEMPFAFAHMLGLEYAVGSLHFDTPEEYAAYAESVVAYETGDTVPTAGEAVFFGPRHDQATRLSADLLLDPLVGGVPGADRPPVVEQAFMESRKTLGTRAAQFKARKVVGARATKDALLETLSPPAGAKPPSLIFTASHGMAFPAGHADQAGAQGALLCQDWPGAGSISPAYYLSGADVPSDARLHGVVTFHFACYGAGTPSHDRFFHKPGRRPPQIAPRPFVAALPKRLLSHPGGGALACIGHVERAWGYSIVSNTSSPQLIPFENAIGRILSGKPVGLAMKDFSEKYAALSADLTRILEKVGFGFAPPADRLARLWVERNDAEGYFVLGDPAVRLRVEKFGPGDG
jgi:hypothetical protein